MADLALSGSGGAHAMKRPRLSSDADAAEEPSDMERAQQQINDAMEAIMSSLTPVDEVALRAVILQPSDCKRINTFLGKCLSDRSEVTINIVASTVPSSTTKQNRAVGRMVISANNTKAFLQLNTNVILCGTAVARAIEEHPEGGSWVLLDQNLHVKSIKTMANVMSERMPAVIDVHNNATGPASSMTMVCNDENSTVVEFKFCTPKPHADDTRRPYFLDYGYVIQMSNEKMRSMVKDMGSSGDVGIEILTQHAVDSGGRQVTMRHMRIIGGDDDAVLARKAQFICKRRNVLDGDGEVKVTQYWEYCEEGSIASGLFKEAPMILRARVTTKLFYLQLLCQNVPSDRAIILCLGMMPDHSGHMPIMVKVPYSADAASASLVKMLVLTNDNPEDDFKHFDDSQRIVPEREGDSGESKHGDGCDSTESDGVQCYQIEDIDNPQAMADFETYCANPDTDALDTAASAFGPDDEEDDAPPAPL